MTDFVIAEAVMLKVQREAEEAQKDQERQEWRKNTDHLKNVV